MNEIDVLHNIFDTVEEIAALLRELKEQWRQPVIVINAAGPQDVERVAAELRRVLEGWRDE